MSKKRPDNPVVPLAEESIRIDKRVEETGRVSVHVEPTVRQQVVELPTVRETVQIERVPINRPVEMPPSIRQDGDVTVIPVVEEVAVVVRQLVLKEEIHIRKRRETITRSETIPLKVEKANVLRSSGADRPRSE